MTIYRGAGGSGDATNDATVTAVAAYAAQAATSATNASGSATSSSTSATNAASSASQAASSATNTASSASQAASSQSAAATSATQAANSATTAGTQATTATNAANSASSSASTATSAASSAASSASAASTSASNAATSATNAANSASSALAIYGNTAAMNAAVTTATNASNSAASSASTATTAATNAAQSAASSQTSATTAQSAAANASAIYGSTAALQAAVTSAQNSATASSASSSTAQTAANTATTQATNASNSATQAAASAASAAAITLGVASNRASIRPSLLLDFANTRQLDPRVTFQRASTGKFYDGTSVVKAEENLLIQSQFASGWSASGTTLVVNTTTAPDATSTAATITAASGSTEHVVQKTGVSLDVSTYTYSYYVQKGTQRYIQMLVADHGGGTRYASAIFDLDSPSGTTQTNNAGNLAYLSSSISNVVGSWYRVSMTFSVSLASTNCRVSIGLAPAATGVTIGIYGLIIWTAAGTETINVWGAQLEQRSTVTAYTPTTTAAITNYIPVLQTALANQPRFDVDPVTGESKGLLIEEQRTNLATYSDQFDNAAWTKSGLTLLSNVVIAPDGTLTADKHILTSGTASGSSALRFDISKAASATTYTYSIYAKAGEATNLRLIPRDVANGTNSVSVYFDLLAGTAGTVTSGGTFTSSGASITSAGNGWYRCSVTFTTSTETSIRVQSLPYGASNISITGNDWSGIYIWGAQLEAGSFATSYIPTVASQVTRSADSASMTGSNFSSWYRADEGTLYGEGVSNSTTTNIHLASIDDGTSSNRIDMRYNTGSLTSARCAVTVNGATSANLDPVGSSLSANRKIAFSCKTNDFAASANASSITSASSGVLPSVSRMLIGVAGYSATTALNGTIKRIAYYPRRLSNSELQGITNNS